MAVTMSWPKTTPPELFSEPGSKPCFRSKVTKRSQGCLPSMTPTGEGILREAFRCNTLDTIEKIVFPLSSFYCFTFRSLASEMTTPRNSVSGNCPGEPMKGPIGMQPVPKVVFRKTPSVVGPTQSFFLRESKALGVSHFPVFHILGFQWSPEADAVNPCTEFSP